MSFWNTTVPRNDQQSEGMLTELSDIKKALATEFSLLIHFELFEFLKEIFKRDRNEKPVRNA